MTAVSEPNINPAVAMIHMIQEQIHERLLRGEMRYRQDRKTLVHHLELAKELKNPVLVAQLQMMIGLVDYEIGNFDSAQNFWNDAYLVFESIPDQSGMGRVQNYLGELHYHYNALDKAQEAFLLARQLAEEVQDVSGIMRAEGNLGLLWLLQDDYQTAKICFSLVVAVTEVEAWQHVSSIINARRGLAEVYLATGDCTAAWYEATEAENLAKGRQLKLLVAQTYLTKAHIAEQDPKARVAADDYYKLARDELREYGNPIVLARTLINEARYYEQKGRLDESTDLALEARDIFVQLNLKTEIEITEAFLTDLANRL